MVWYWLSCRSVQCFSWRRSLGWNLKNRNNNMTLSYPFTVNRKLKGHHTILRTYSRRKIRINFSLYFFKNMKTTEIVLWSSPPFSIVMLTFTSGIFYFSLTELAPLSFSTLRQINEGQWHHVGDNPVIKQ